LVARYHTSPVLKNVGVTDEDMKRIVVYGNEDGEQMNLIKSTSREWPARVIFREDSETPWKWMRRH
jgi:hypothetical protein